MKAYKSQKEHSHNLLNDSSNRHTIASHQLLVHLRFFGTHKTILNYIGLESEVNYPFFLSISFRCLLINLTQFLSDKNTSSLLKIIQSHSSGSYESKMDILQKCVVEEVKILLPDSPRPSPRRVEAVRSYLRTLSNVTFPIPFISYINCDWKFRFSNSRQQYVEKAYVDLLPDFVKQETPPPISAIRLNSFPFPIQVPKELSWEVMSVILRSNSLTVLDFCFQFLSKQQFKGSPHPLESHVLLGLVEKAVHLIRNHRQILVHKRVFETLLKWVNWDRLEVTSMFPLLLPLLSETARLISNRRKTYKHTVFLNRVTTNGIDKLWTTDLAVSQSRSIASAILRIAMNLPTDVGTCSIIDAFALQMTWAKSAREKEISTLLFGVLIEEGCEDLYVSVPLDKYHMFRFRALINRPIFFCSTSLG